MESVFIQVMKKLVAAGIDNPRLETRMILAEVLQSNVAAIYEDIKVNLEQYEKIMSMLDRRMQHEPLDKILGYRSFYKDEFKVNANVLSPRPDTEILVEKALAYMQKKSSVRVLDLGTGSGCIIITLLKEKQHWHGTAVDVSAQALQIARENAQNLGVTRRLKFAQADWFDADIIKNIGQQFDLIVSNPPYIPSAQIAGLTAEVRCYDPRIALDGGDDGFVAYKRIAQIAPQLLLDGGYILLEAGYNQAEQIADIFFTEGLQKVEIAKDLAGINRCVIMQKAVAEQEKN